MTLCLEDTEETRKIWDKSFRLLYTVTLAATSLRIDVEVENTNKNPGDIFPLTFALHTYFDVPDVTHCRLDGAFKGKYFKVSYTNLSSTLVPKEMLSIFIPNISLGLTFKDKTEEGHPDTVEDRAAITLGKFTDRVYYNAPNTCVLNGMHDGKGIYMLHQ